MPSGHAAAAFAAWAAVTIIAEPLRHAALVSTLAFLMALLVAQSRVEAGIHSLAEVGAGAILGTGVAILVFQLLG
jgi:diacylglycerol kinase (ATP)